MSTPSSAERAFARYLEGLHEREDRAALAALRRGLGKRPGEAAEMHPYVVPWLPPDAMPGQEETYYLIASLFAWHPTGWPAGAHPREATNLGASFARLAQRAESGSLEGRFVALLNCHQEDLPAHLRRAVGLLKSKEIPVDWAQLLSDVRSWGWESRSVQLEWARAFWGGRRESPPSQPSQPSPDVEAEQGVVDADN